MTETQNTEYKEIWRDEYLEWVAGFANADGGVLYIGKDDAGKTVGLARTKKLMEDIPNKIRNILGITADVSLLDDGGLGSFTSCILPVRLSKSAYMTTR